MNQWNEVKREDGRKDGVTTVTFESNDLDWAAVTIKKGRVVDVDSNSYGTVAKEVAATLRAEGFTVPRDFISVAA